MLEYEEIIKDMADALICEYFCPYPERDFECKAFVTDNGCRDCVIEFFKSDKYRNNDE